MRFFLRGLTAGLILAVSNAGIWAQDGRLSPDLTGPEILAAVDENVSYRSSRTLSEMKIYDGDDLVATQRLLGYARGRKKALTEVLHPSRDEGTRLLKLDDKIWMYIPDVDRVIKLAGHLLRQSVLGSDFSYEDLLEGSQTLAERYTARRLEDEEWRERKYYKIDLEARDKSVAYARQIMWVDPETFLPRKQELYSRQGKLLKLMETEGDWVLENRHYPRRFILRDLLRQSTHTEMEVLEAAFNIDLDDEIFTVRYLRRP
ncbi:MAG: outer membrane lipoprotein-sorting protein [Candidatus Eisenbacteria bacterium]|nr:outer membrane lipoprotein-sorting protein [Candidatus Eisenbacteria bacterium]